MSSIQEAQDFADKVNGLATCHLLNAGTAFAASVAVNSVYTGQVWGVVGGTAGTAAFAALGIAAGCYDNPDTPTDLPPATGCMMTDVGTHLRAERTDGTGQYFTLTTDATAITFIEQIKEDDGDDNYRVRWRNSDGTSGSGTAIRNAIGEQKIYLVTGDGVNCLIGGDDRQPIGNPYDYIDDDGCNWKVTPIDVYVGKDGLPHIYWEATSPTPECGGPYRWWDNPSDKPIPVGPNPPGGPGPIPPPDLPSPGKDYSDDFTDIRERLDRIEQCACDETPPKPTLEGDWVTTQWKSDEKDDITGTRLRKRFRYRSKSSRNLEQLSDYWKGFTWQAGQVCVIHKDTWWGTPQVWAATADEGKRVIRFAGAEAGIDPDQMGQWVVSGSRTPRYGMSGTMRLIDKDGFPWVASRDGADWPNYLAR